MTDIKIGRDLKNPLGKMQFMLHRELLLWKKRNMESSFCLGNL